MRAHSRAAAVPARDRHALRARAVLRDRRVGALRSSRPALLLARSRPLRAHHRRAAPARVDHQGRLHPRPPATGRGRLPLPPRPRRRGSARAPPTRTSTRDHQHLLARATPAQRPLAPTQRHPPQTRRDRRSRDRPRTRRLLLGDRYLPHSARTDTHTDHSQEADQLALTLPRTLPVAAGEAARASRLAHTNSAIRRLSNAHPGAALDFRQRTCDEQRSWGTQPPNMSMTTVANPRTPGPPRKPQPHHPRTTNQTMASNPYPLTTAPPYGRRRDGRDSSALRPAGCIRKVVPAETSTAYGGSVSQSGACRWTRTLNYFVTK